MTNRRTTIVLLLVAVLLATFLVLTQTGTLSLGGEEEATETPSAFEAVFAEAEGDSVIAFEITDNETGDVFAATSDTEDLSWQVTEAPSQPEEGQVVDAGRLTVVTNALNTLVYSRILERGEFESFADFGLDAPRYTLVYNTLGGGAFTLDIGGETTDGGSYYTQRPGDDVVLVVSSAVLGPFVDLLTEPPYAEPTPTLEPLPTP